MVITQKQSSNLEHLVIPINGMSCASCASRIEKNIAGLEGVMHAGVNLGPSRRLLITMRIKFLPPRFEKLLKN